MYLTLTSCSMTAVEFLVFVRVLGGDTECPLQVCHLSRSSESTHFLSLRRHVALLDSTRAEDDF